MDNLLETYNRYALPSSIALTLAPSYSVHYHFPKQWSIVASLDEFWSLFGLPQISPYSSVQLVGFPGVSDCLLSYLYFLEFISRCTPRLRNVELWGSGCSTPVYVLNLTRHLTLHLFLPSISLMLISIRSATFRFSPRTLQAFPKFAIRKSSIMANQKAMKSFNTLKNVLSEGKRPSMGCWWVVVCFQTEVAAEKQLLSFYHL